MDPTDFYYNLDDALEERGLIASGTDELEHLKLDPKTDDPYLQAVYCLYGIFGDESDSSVLYKAHDLFKQIYDGTAIYPAWGAMRTSIKAFAAFKLSLIYLGFHGIKRDLKKSEQYQNDAIKHLHRQAIMAKADELFEALPDAESAPGVAEVLELYKKTYSLGNKKSIEGILSCYEMLNDFDSITRHYAATDLDTKNIKEYVSYFNSMYHRGDEKTQPDMIEKFILTLIHIKNDEVKKNMFKYSNLFSEELLDSINSIIAKLARETNDASYDKKSIILENLLIVFNSNNLLYKGYINKLLSPKT
jgi:hypothetical protein